MAVGLPEGVADDDAIDDLGDAQHHRLPQFAIIVPAEQDQPVAVAGHAAVGVFERALDLLAWDVSISQARLGVRTPAHWLHASSRTTVDSLPYTSTTLTTMRL